jgi:hypothetical protein
MTLILPTLHEIRSYYKKASDNENACGSEVLISRKMDGISVIYPTSVHKIISRYLLK